MYCFARLSFIILPVHLLSRSIVGNQLFFSSPQSQYGVVTKKEHHEDDSRPFSDIARDDEQDHKMKLESVSVGCRAVVDG